MLLHIHETTWTVAIVLFLISYFLITGKKMKAHKPVYMIARLFYVFILITGVILLIQVNFEFMAVIKGILAIILIGIMEMLTARALDGRKTGLFWAIFIILLAIILYIGYGVLT